MYKALIAGAVVIGAVVLDVTHQAATGSTSRS